MADEPRTARALDVPGLAPTGPSWAQAVAANGFVWISGQVALDAAGRVVGRGSIGEQAEYVLGQVARALDAAGCGLRDLVRMGVYLTDREHLTAFRAVRDRLLVDARPASTLVIVASLVEPELLVEVEAVAALR